MFAVSQRAEKHVEAGTHAEGQTTKLQSEASSSANVWPKRKLAKFALLPHNTLFFFLPE